MRVCIFLDERYESKSGGTRFIVSAVVGGRETWDAFAPTAPHVGALKARRQLNAIDGFLEGFGAATIGFADAPSELAVPGVDDSTGDILRTSRIDNLWSWIFVSVVTDCLGRLCGAGADDVEVEIFHDPKDLTADHYASIKRFVKENLPAMAAELPNKPRVRLRCFESIPKADQDDTLTNLQVGTMFAHHLCAHLRHAVMRPDALRVVRTRNFTESFLETANVFALHATSFPAKPFML